MARTSGIGGSRARDFGMGFGEIRTAVREPPWRHSSGKTRILVQFPARHQHSAQHNNYVNLKHCTMAFPQVNDSNPRVRSHTSRGVNNANSSFAALGGR